MEPWAEILSYWYVNIECEPIDEFSNIFDVQVSKFKNLIMNKKYNEVFDFPQFLFRHPKTSPDLYKKLQNIIEQYHCAYSVIDEGPTIIPATTEQEAQSIKQAVQSAQEAGFHGAHKHLLEATECVNSENYAGAVRESIHAVESVACILNENSKTSLKPALNELEKKINIHQALKNGFSSIYGYTNDEEGIRHALHEEEANIDEADALFMIGACASFVTYLLKNLDGYERHSYSRRCYAICPCG